MIETIAFDADDTLWHNETIYLEAAVKLEGLLKKYRDVSSIYDVVNETEMNNLQHFGYGIKSYVLSMIETAVRFTGGRIDSTDMLEIIQFGREMMGAEVRLMEGAAETVSSLARKYPLLLITKGDQFEQEGKIERSGMADYFQHIEIVSEKSVNSYSAILENLHIDPRAFLMVGNSLRSDIRPVVAIGGQAVFIPYPATWKHENMLEEPLAADQYHQLEHLGQLPALIQEIERYEE
jgi:putative hydrolase of the HAD superfamily